ncbi:MAG TPA: hypothetical protein VEQ60_14085, partial [Longimicrobium sp.]|nr:hypothetical protein [Longimicrobium sp.]
GQLRNEIQKANLPEEVSAFVLEQIGIIEEALENYEVTGARAFRRALVEASLSYSDHEVAVDQHKQAPEVQSVLGIWGTIAKMNERTEIVSKLLTSGVKIGKLIGDVADALNRVV